MSYHWYQLNRQGIFQFVQFRCYAACLIVCGRIEILFSFPFLSYYTIDGIQSHIKKEDILPQGHNGITQISQSTTNQAYICVLCAYFEPFVVKSFTTKRGRTTEAMKNSCPEDCF
jgi:hypothetical protein